ncbi:hypothetical protein ACFX5D_14670 [Flavobacterium sp. LB3P45]|uniref:Uncharacterized protein n=1 Tax=Flavobacterium fructosi TaxID=3230416 RepID=A0ABW6HQ79_9FLAO
MTNKTLIFSMICGIILLYFIYNLIVHILDTINRNNEIEIAENSMLKANKEMHSAKQELIAEIEKQYNSDYAEKVAKGTIWMGMPDILLSVALGRAGEIKESFFKDKVTEKWYYNGYRTRLNTYKYRLEVIVENYKVAGWKDL